MNLSKEARDIVDTILIAVIIGSAAMEAGAAAEPVTPVGILFKACTDLLKGAINAFSPAPID